MDEELTIAGLLSADPEFSLLVAALDQTGLTASLAAPLANFTMLAPTNDGIIEFARSVGFNGMTTSDRMVLEGLIAQLDLIAEDGDGEALLADVLGAHIVFGERTVDALSAAGVVATTSGAGVIFEEEGIVDADPDRRAPVAIEGRTDLAATNGVVHAIDGVVVPVDLPDTAARTTLVDLLVSVSSDGGFDANGSDFDILIAAISAAGLTPTFSDPAADLGVLAPTDSAFIRLAQDLGGAPGDEGDAFNAIVGALAVLDPAGNPLALLEGVLLYHTLDSALTRLEIGQSSSLTTLLGAGPAPGARFLGDAEPDLEDAAFVPGSSDLIASNGIAHPIDRVLLPIDIEGNGETPTLTGGVGNDIFFIEPGVELVQGAGGIDTARFEQSLLDVEVSPAAGGFAAVIGEGDNEQRILLESVERFEFADATAQASFDEQAATVARLYLNGLGIDPDIPGVSFWNDIATGLGVEAVADFFVVSDAFVSNFGPPPYGMEFVEDLYTELLGREAEPEGLAFWTDALAAGQVDEGDLLLLFSESEEGKAVAINVFDDGVLLLV